MKLVEILAKEMDKWPEECNAGYCMQANESTEVFFGGPAKSIFLSALADDRDDEKVTKEQWQAERDRQKSGEWKRARGSKPKYETETPQRMEVRHRDGNITKGWTSQSWNWSHNDGCPSADIMAWRVISQPQADEAGKRLFKDVLGTNFPKGTTIHGPLKMGETVIAPAHPEYKGTDTNMGTLSYTVDIDTSPAIKALNELSAKWDQVESPFKWRDTVNELNAYIEEFTRERDDLINRLALEGFALIPAMTAVIGSTDIEISSSEWEVGDILEIVDSRGKHTHEFKIGEHVRVEGFDDDSLPVRCNKLDNSDYWYIQYNEAKFVSRP